MRRVGSGRLTRCLTIALASLSCTAVALRLSAKALPAQAVNSHAPFFAGMRQIQTIDEVAVSPDGRWAAYVTRAAFDPDTTGVGNVTVLNLARHGCRTIAIRGNPHALQWAPGKHESLAFVARAEGRSRIWRYSPLDSGSAPRVITISDSLGGEILAFTWSPDGASMAYIATEDEEGSGTPKARPPIPRLVLFNDSPGDYTGPTSPLYSRDSTGAYVAIAQLSHGRARVLTRHVISRKGTPTVAWSRAGMLLVNGVAMRVSWGSMLRSGLVSIINPASGAVNQMAPSSGSMRRAVWSPSGKQIAYFRFQFLPEGRLPLTRYTLQVESPSQSRSGVSYDAETDGIDPALPPMWGGDDQTLYVARVQHATARLFAISVSGGTWRPVTPDTLSVSRYAISRDGRVLLGVLENANQPQEVFRIDPGSGALTPLTHEADRLPARSLGHVDEIEWRSRDGRFTIHGFLVLPRAYDPTRRYPLIVLLHGGPGYPFTNSFVGINFAPYQLPPHLLAAAGYMVLLPNPRGDPGYGEEFRHALHAGWGTGPFADIDAGVDALIARGLVDSSYIGVAGSSYGGYLAAFAIGHTRRYAAASIDDAPVDLMSEYGQNYATRASWAKAAFGGTPWTRPEAYALQSPIMYVSRVRTPVIMRYGGRSSTHDEVRQSYMLAQGFEFYAGLRDTGVPVEFVLHPDQGHGITDWDLYRDWVVRNLLWFDYWILHEGINPLTSIPQ
jgi:dipeptidyl aminopeptidase/acylaminoacyl peptidase